MWRTDAESSEKLGNFLRSWDTDLGHEASDPMPAIGSRRAGARRQDNPPQGEGGPCNPCLRGLGGEVRLTAGGGRQAFLLSCFTKPPSHCSVNRISAACRGISSFLGFIELSQTRSCDNNFVSRERERDGQKSEPRRIKGVAPLTLTDVVSLWSRVPPCFTSASLPGTPHGLEHSLDARCQTPGRER